VLKVDKTEFNCGGAGAVALDLAALGARCRCIGVTGCDQNGEVIEKKLKEAGIDTGNLLAVAGRSTISKERLIGLAQHRHRQQLMRIDEGPCEPLSQEMSKKVLHAARGCLRQADIICLQDNSSDLLEPHCAER